MLKLFGMVQYFSKFTIPEVEELKEIILYNTGRSDLRP